jgi:hypothetical protein
MLYYIFYIYYTKKKGQQFDINFNKIEFENGGKTQISVQDSLLNAIARQYEVVYDTFRIFILNIVFASMLLYDIFQNVIKKHKEDGHSDEELALCILKDLAERVFQHYKVGNITVSERIIAAFKTKIWRMLKTEKKARKSFGGRGRKELIAKWSDGKLSSWKLKVYYEDVDSVRVQQENKCLKGEKRKLEKELENVTSKCRKVERKLEKAVGSLGTSKKKFRKLTKKLIDMQRQHTNARGLDKNKSFEDYTKRHQRRLKEQLTADCETSLSYLGIYGFVATEVKVFNLSNEEYETFTLVNEHEHNSTMTTSEVNNVDYINLLLYTKDRFGVSNQAYHELSMICKEMPRSWKVNERIKEINKKWNLTQTPGNFFGVQQTIKERLVIRLKALIESGTACLTDKKLRVKLSGDGTNIGKRLHVVNITFTILEEGDKAMAADGNHLVAVIKVPENYSNLCGALVDIRNEVESLSNISVGNEVFDIEWFLGGDWKFLACVCGLGAAHANSPCIWCKCTLYDKFDPSKTWSLLDITKGARTIAEIQELAAKKKSSSASHNVKNAPLFPSISLDHVIIDLLHLFLRISDNLINLLILHLRKADSIEKKRAFNEGFERSKYRHMAAWENYLNERLKIPFNWFVCKDSKKLKWRDLTGPEKIKLFRNIKIGDILLDDPKTETVQELWDNFMSLIETLSSSNSAEVNVEKFKQDTQSWFELFLSIYPAKHVTPYMHALLWHVPEFLELYGKIHPFTQQGLEKLNDKTTKDFFRSTNQRGIDALFQLVEKRNRMEYLEDLGCTRQPRDLCCSNCKEVGHNIKTCTEECSICSFKPCCSPNHIEKLGGSWSKICESE